MRWTGLALGRHPADSGAPGRYLDGTWREQIRRNAEALLDDSPGRGVGALGVLADRLEEWLAAAPPHEPALRRELPVSSFVDIGAARHGHARWLRRAARFGPAALAAHADTVTALARQWDTVASLWLGGTGSPATGTRMLQQVPRLLRILAREERATVERVAVTAGAG
ncbi:hypothetical protein [Streptomyces litchfieldiae]|uniref:Uncharacterized protein n=1 Tax=Streptomyces litchfieldiae TaxID=3075543 RepID=A0ABU2MQT5_9ACTN|nr:hypothetical protein [Streptomyces sp. DSM 44938]MDT0343984.1 hypothetical protein [Streptomyces sp. DSM 44938]